MRKVQQQLRDYLTKDVKQQLVINMTKRKFFDDHQDNRSINETNRYNFVSNIHVFFVVKGQLHLKHFSLATFLLA